MRNFAVVVQDGQVKLHGACTPASKTRKTHICLPSCHPNDCAQHLTCPSQGGSLPEAQSSAPPAV